MSERSKYYPNITPDYTDHGSSVYGDPDPVTLSILSNLKGTVLEVGAGDGRYTHPMIEQGLAVVAGDVDKKGLDSLIAKTAQSDRSRLQPVIFDAFEPYPFSDESVDGVVSTAFLYLFPQEDVRQIMEESHRVIRSGGHVVVDFVTDRKRLGIDGREIKGENEFNYSLQQGEVALLTTTAGLFTDSEMHYSSVKQDLRESVGYTMNANKITFKGRRK